jgi:hypothetical protein
MTPKNSPHTTSNPINSDNFTFATQTTSIPTTRRLNYSNITDESAAEGLSDDDKILRKMNQLVDKMELMTSALTEQMRCINELMQISITLNAKINELLPQERTTPTPDALPQRQTLKLTGLSSLDEVNAANEGLRTDKKLRNILVSFQNFINNNATLNF